MLLSGTLLEITTRSKSNRAETLPGQRSISHLRANTVVPRKSKKLLKNLSQGLKAVPETRFHRALCKLLHSDDFFSQSADDIRKGFKKVLQTFLPFELKSELSKNKLLWNTMIANASNIFCNRAEKAIQIFAAIPMSRPAYAKVEYLKAMQEIYNDLLSSHKEVFGHFNPSLGFTELTGKTLNPLFYQSISQKRIGVHPLGGFTLRIMGDSVFVPGKITKLDKKSLQVLVNLFGEHDPSNLRLICVKNDPRYRVSWSGIAGDNYAVLNIDTLIRDARVYRNSSSRDHVEGIGAHELAHSKLYGKGLDVDLDSYSQFDDKRMSNVDIHEFIAWTAALMRREEVAIDILFTDQPHLDYRYAAEFLNEKVKEFFALRKIPSKRLRVIKEEGDIYSDKALKFKKYLGAKLYREMVDFLRKAFLKQSHRIMKQIFKS